MPTPLEKFEDRIKKNEPVTAEDVERAFSDEEAAYNRLCDSLGKSADDPDRKAHIEELEKKKEKMLSEKDLAAAYKEGRLRDVFESSRKERESVIGESQKKHQEAYLKAQEYWRGKTAPGDDGIPDYEGYSAGGEGLTDENANNKTRWTLSGYLTALELNDPQEAGRVMGEAKNIYEKSDEGFFDTDRAFDYEHLQNNLDLKLYMADLERFDLAGESMGLLCGYMKISETLYAENRVGYHDYLFGKLDDMKSKGLLDYSGAGEEDYMADYHKGEKQMRALMEIVTPKDFGDKLKGFKQRLDELGDDFDRFKSDAQLVAAKLGFEYGDAGLKELLGSDRDAVTRSAGADIEGSGIAAVEKKISAARETAGKEAILKLRTAGDGCKSDLDALAPRIAKIKEDNMRTGKLAEREVADMEARASAAGKTLEGAGLAGTPVLDENFASAYADKVFSVKIEIEDLKKRAGEMEAALAAPGGGSGPAEGAGAGAPGAVPGGAGAVPGGGAETGPRAGLDQYEGQWPGAEVEGRFKKGTLIVSPNIENGAAYRDDNGKKLGNIPANTRLELADPSGKCRKVGEIVFVKVSFGDKQVWVDEGELELEEAPSGSLEVPPEIAVFLKDKNLEEVLFNGNYWYRLGEITDKKLAPGAGGPLSPGAKVNSCGNKDVDSLFLQKAVGRAMTKEESDMMNGLYKKARKESQFGYEARPAIAEMRTDYEGKFLRVWREYAAKLEAALGGAEAAEKDPALKFLGKVNNEYREALTILARDGAKPEGGQFEVISGKSLVTCKFGPAPDGRFKISWPKGYVLYPSARDAMIAVNGGALAYSMTLVTLRTPAAYAPYEDLVDALDEETLHDSGVPGETMFVLDWAGTGKGEGNALVFATPQPFGGIKYRVQRDRAGVDGGNMREGYAPNFDDFMHQLGHIKKWAEDESEDVLSARLGGAGAAPGSDELVEAQKANLRYLKEFHYGAVHNSSLYYAAEGQIGRPLFVSMAPGLYSRETTQVHLDWGGVPEGHATTGYWGRDGGIANPLLTVWVNEAGSISYTVRCDRLGIKPVEKRVNMLAQIFAELERLRKGAGA